MPFPTENNHENKPLRLLIVGGGVAGLVLAKLLERQGHKVTIAERAREWKPVGGGITLTLNGVAALRSIGLLPAIYPHANAIEHIHIADREGKLLSTFDLREYNASYAPTLTIHRSVLHAALAAQLRDTVVHTNTTVVHIDELKDKVFVTLANRKPEAFDVVIGCDGIYSCVRQHIFPKVRMRYAGYASWRFVVQSDLANNNALTEMWGAGKRFGIVPLANGSVHCFAAINTGANNVAHSHINLAAFKKLFAGFGGAVPALLHALQQEGSLMYNDLEDVRLPKWYKGRIVLIGDAAHGMTPNMTQGASLAIEDAITLADQLGKTAVPKALHSFQLLRTRRVNAIQRKSWMFGRIGQVQHPALCALRNACWKHIPDSWIQNDLKQLLAGSMGQPGHIASPISTAKGHAVYHT